MRRDDSEGTRLYAHRLSRCSAFRRIGFAAFLRASCGRDSFGARRFSLASSEFFRMHAELTDRGAAVLAFVVPGPGVDVGLGDGAVWVWPRPALVGVAAFVVSHDSPIRLRGASAVPALGRNRVPPLRALPSVR